MIKRVNYRKICQEHYGYSDEQMKGMQVHHIDGNHENNVPENLQLVTPEEHAQLHEHMRNWSNWIKNQPEAAKRGGAWHKGKKKSSEWIANHSERMKGNKFGVGKKSLEEIERMCIYLRGRTWTLPNGMDLSDEEVERRKNHMNTMNSKLETCEYCGKVGQMANMKRWHGEKCKMKS